MASDNDTAISVLNDLIETSKDGVNGFREAAEAVTRPDAKALFASEGCGGCHELADAGTQGGTGPNLDETLRGKDEAYIREGIVDPNAELAKGFQEGIMPPNYEQTMEPSEIDALVKYLEETTNG